jgi:hypothetical protein
LTQSYKSAQYHFLSAQAWVYNPLKDQLNKKVIKMATDIEIYTDEGVLRGGPNTAPTLAIELQLNEGLDTPRVPKPARWLALINQAGEFASEKFNRHKVAYSALGGVVLTGVGVAGGAAVFGRH